MLPRGGSNTAPPACQESGVPLGYSSFTCVTVSYSVLHLMMRSTGTLCVLHLVCVCICDGMCVCFHSCKCMCAKVCFRWYVCICVCMLVNACVWCASVCVMVCMCIHLCMYAFDCACVCVCVCVCA